MIVLAPYELPVALAGSLDEKQTKEAIEEIKKLIADSKGEIQEIEEWGKKSLHYPISKEKTAFYYLINFEVDSKVIPNFNKKLKMQDNVLRFLVIKKEQPKKFKEKKVKAKEAKKDN